MKNTLTFFGIITFFVLIGFFLSACGDGGDNDEKTSIIGGYFTSNSLKITNADVYDTEVDTVPITGNTYDGDYSDNITNYGFAGQVAKIQNGKLIVDLSVPTSDKLSSFQGITGITVTPPTAKATAFMSFFNESKHKSIVLRKSSKVILFFFTDNNGSINGTGDLLSQGANQHFNNIILKKGWNALLYDRDTGNINNVTIDSSFKWRGYW